MNMIIPSSTRNQQQVHVTTCGSSCRCYDHWGRSTICAYLPFRSSKSLWRRRRRRGKAKEGQSGYSINLKSILWYDGRRNGVQGGTAPRDSHRCGNILGRSGWRTLYWAAQGFSVRRIWILWMDWRRRPERRRRTNDPRRFGVVCNFNRRAMVLHHLKQWRDLILVNREMGPIGELWWDVSQFTG